MTYSTPAEPVLTPLPHRGLLRAAAWVGVAAVGSIVAAIVGVLAERDGTATDVAIVAAIGWLGWLVCLLPAAWLIESHRGRARWAELWYDVRLGAWRLHDRWASDRTGRTADNAAWENNSADDDAVTDASIPPAASVITRSPGGVIVPAELRARRPDSLLLNGDVMPLESDGDVLRTAWAIAAFLDVIQNGITGVVVPMDEGIATARKDALDVGVRIAAEIVGTKIPARLRERLEQRQFLVTACVVKHYALLDADQVRDMLTARGHDPIAVWGAADAYLSGYYHCRSWDEARAMAPRMLRLPPPSRA